MFFKSYRIFLVSIILITITIIASAEPPIEVIYWKSSDIQAPTQQDIDSLGEMMSTVQYFFASEMDRYGYGQKTFDFNKDITIVEGKKKLNEYTNAWMIQNEYTAIERGLNNAIYVVFVGGATSFGAGGVAVSQPLCAIAIPEELKLCNNLVVIPADNKHLREVLTAHEIGHAFTLDHPPNRLVKNKVDVMFFPLHATPGVTEYLTNYVLNPKHAKFLYEDNRLFIQGIQDINKGMYIDNPDLVAYYPFDKNTKDVSQNRNDGRIIGKASYVKGKFGNAIKLNNYVYVQMNASKSLHGDLFKVDSFTLSLWVYSEKETGYGHVWRSLPNNKGADTLFIIEDSGIVSWRGRIDGNWSWGNLCETRSGTFKSGTWFHVALTNDGDKLRIYVNGEKTAETDFQETDGGNTVYRIGSAYRYVNENFVGSIDDYAIFSRALTEDEINEIIKTGVATFLENKQLGTMEHSYLPEDINRDGVVDLEDVKIVRSAMQNSTSYDTDVNDDGVTDEDDLALVKLKAVEAILAASPGNPYKGKIRWTSWGSIKNIR